MSSSLANGIASRKVCIGSCRSTSDPDASTMVAFDGLGVEIGLQVVDRVIDLLAERDPIKLVQDRAMEALVDAVGLRTVGFCAAVIGVLDREVWLVFVALCAANSVPRSVSIRDSRMPCTIKRHHPFH